ncbi:MAG: radical SAM protein [Candidatus Gracilibacteria bacterium]|nr:radical SAM protein [Candidatus Gracilibacteria bacterium]
MEFPNMEQVWNKKVSKYDILKKLIKYKKLGYNHVTYLGGEPFIQPVFLDALVLGKKLQYTILVTTNCTTLHIDKQASKFLPYIDELILSVEAIDKEKQQLISRTQNYVHWESVFENIKKYWKGSFLKANIVITQDNKDILFDLVKYLNDKGIKRIAITYPDLTLKYYGIQHTLERIAPKYSECINQIVEIIHYCNVQKIELKLPDFPFCIFPTDKVDLYLKLTDDYDFATRLKIQHTEEKLDRGDLTDESILPRNRRHISKCGRCKYEHKCWGPSVFYDELYGLSEINPIF